MKSRTFALLALLSVATALYAVTPPPPAVNIFASPASGQAYSPAPTQASKVTISASVVNGYQDATTKKRYFFQMQSTTGERYNGFKESNGTTASWTPDPQVKPGTYQLSVTVAVIRNSDNQQVDNLQKFSNSYVVKPKK